MRDPFAVFDKRFSPGLERVGKAFKYFFPHGYRGSKGAIKSVLVTGSNGKGSVVSFIENLLVFLGYRVGSFTSPHLIDVAERFKINGRKVEHTILKKTAEELHALFPDLTYFEATFIAASLIFSREDVEYAVFEVGMGGRLDATNVVFPKEVVVITDVSLEHKNYLGPTLLHIAKEKSALCRGKIPAVICSPFPKNLLVELAVLLEGGRISRVKIPASLHVASLKNRVIPFYQYRNFCCALKTLLNLGVEVSPELISAFVQNLSKFYPPGRFTQVRGALVDGAHNPAAVRQLLRSLLEINFPFRKLIFYSFPDKEWKKELKMLSRYFQDFVYVPLGYAPRGEPLDPEEVISFAKGLFRETSIAFELPPPEEGFLYTGSLYLAGEFFKRFGFS